MKIDKLTVKEVREIQEMFNAKNESVKESVSMLSKYIGKYVIVRTRNEGINAGYVKDLDSTGIILKDARRIYYHKPKDKSTSWYEGVSLSGLSSDSKVSAPTIEKGIIEDYSITLCSKISEENIIKHPTTNTSC